MSSITPYGEKTVATTAFAGFLGIFVAGMICLGLEARKHRHLRSPKVILTGILLCAAAMLFGLLAVFIAWNNAAA